MAAREFFEATPFVFAAVFEATLGSDLELVLVVLESTLEVFLESFPFGGPSESLSATGLLQNLIESYLSSLRCHLLEGLVRACQQLEAQKPS
jgi:hypothetical protein